MSRPPPPPGLDTPPPAQPPRPLRLPAFTQHTLANGLRVVVAPRHALPLVSVALLVRAGPERDPPGRAGTAALTAALLGKGARRGAREVGASALAQQAEALGAALESSASWRSSHIAMTVATPRLDAAAQLLADLVRRPTLAAAELDRLRAQALDGLRVSLQDPAAVAGLVARRAYWGEAAYGRAVTPASLRRIGRADVQAFHARHYRPARTVLVLAGDVAAERGVALAERLFGHWHADAWPADDAPPVPPAAAAPDTPLLLVDMPGSGQCAVVVAAPFVAQESADRRIAQVANAVLGGGYSARLNQEVRIKRGLSYGAFSEAEAHPGAGMASATTQTSHANAAQALQLLRGEIERLAEAPPAAEELAARQATLVGSFARRLDTTGGLATLVMAQLAQGRPLDELARRVAEILAVTPAQVQAFAQQHWRAAALRGVIVGDLKAAGEALATLPGPRRRIVIERLDLERADLGAEPP